MGCDFVSYELDMRSKCVIMCSRVGIMSSQRMMLRCINKEMWSNLSLTTSCPKDIEQVLTVGKMERGSDWSGNMYWANDEENRVHVWGFLAYILIYLKTKVRIYIILTSLRICTMMTL